MQHKNWYAVITAKVLYADDISSRQKLLVAVISNMSNEKGHCFATNAAFADMFGCSERSVRRDLEDLEKKKYIGRVIKLKPSGEVDYRALTIIEGVGTPMTVPPRTPVSAPPDTSVHIITKNNNTPSKGISLKHLLKQLFETLTEDGRRDARLFYKKYGIKHKSQVLEAVQDFEIRLTNRGKQPKNMYELRREWDYYCNDVLDSKHKNKPWK